MVASMTAGLATPSGVVAGILFPQSILSTTWFAVLATFVAVNTIMYAALGIAKALPKLYPRDWLPRRYTRSQTRSIYPDATEGAPPEGLRPPS